MKKLKFSLFFVAVLIGLGLSYVSTHTMASQIITKPCSCDDAVKGCETSANQIHWMLFSCEDENSTLRNKLETCRDKLKNYKE